MITVVHTSDLRRPFLSADCHIGDADVTGFFFEKTPTVRVSSDKGAWMTSAFSRKVCNAVSYTHLTLPTKA